MISIQSILSAIKSKLVLESEKTEKIAMIIEKYIHVTISPSAITLKRTHIALSLSPTVKMAILLKKETILNEIRAQGIEVSTIG